MRKLLALIALSALQPSCEPFPNENEGKYEDAREAFEHWKEAMIAGRLAECVHLTTQSLRSQWVFDRLDEGDRAALGWKAKLKEGARTDLDLWFSEAVKSTTSGRVPTLPPTVLADASLTPLLVGYLKDAQPDVARDFRNQKIIQVSSDAVGVSVVARNARNEPEIYVLAFEEGFWKVDGHRKKGVR